MSEDEAPNYKDGDTVWVKLGPCWWPGEVTENAPEDFTSKKPPLAIVKFFNETTYEFVKSHSHIYYYNCERKNEFIRKGMDSFRANNAHMSKFPGDVSLAEIRTDGNPNILSDPMFAPQKKSNVIAEVFGSPSPKKTLKENRQLKGKKNSAKKPKLNITHRRFLGCDDYEAHIRVQYPGKDTEHLSSDEEILRLNAEPSQNFNCSTCTFTTNRLEVMLFHVQCHIKGIASPVQVKKRLSPKKKSKKSRIVKHITSEDDRTNSSDSEEEKPKPKRKKRVSSPRKPKQKKEELEEEEEKPATDIRSHLLAEWSDSEENEEESGKQDTSEVKKEEVEDKVEEEEKVGETKDPSKSCFDFDEEEEDNSLVHTAVGRKIPRVIPPTDKRKSLDSENEASLPIAEDDENRMEILKTSHSVNDSSSSVQNDSEVSKEEEVFKDLMDSTLVPDMPEVPPPTTNLPEEKAVKIPDKSTEIATKLTNPKKRFVKSFEDFELLQNEQRRAQEEKEEEKRREEAGAVPDAVASSSTEDNSEPFSDNMSIVEENSTPQSEIEEKSEEIKFEQEEKTEPEPEIKAEPGPEAKAEPEPEEKAEPEPEEKAEPEPEEKAELKLEEKTELKMEEKTEPKPEETEKATTKPEATIRPDARTKPDSNLQISKLKTQVMSKLSDEEPEPPKRSKFSHKTPRSKILEFYRNDKSKEETKTERKKLKRRVSEMENEKIEEETVKKEAASEAIKEEEESEAVKEAERNEAIKEAEKSETIKKVEAIPEKNPDEEIGKINKIDDYLNDFLFDFPKKNIEPETKPEVKKEENCENNEVLIKCGEDSGDAADISIKTNLSNFDSKEEDLSALSTLAMVSQLETVEKKIFDPKPEPELVSIDGNLTVVSEKDLADGQVEITATASKKPVTLTNFSMDFSDSNSGEEKPKKVPEPGEAFDIEEHIPSQIVDKTKPSPGSKLLERLTEQKPVKVPTTTKDAKLPKTKYVIKSAVNKPVKPPIVMPSKQLTLTEKIKSVSDVSGSVSVQKITSKRNLQDPDEIDTFIIHKGAQKAEEEEVNEDVPVKKIRKNTTGMDPKKLAVSSAATNVKKRGGKAKILQQTIITPAGEIIQPSSAAVSQDDNVFDINSMPIVLSDQILTPESIENMPIYLSETVQSTPEPSPKPQATTLVKKTPVTSHQPSQSQMRVLNKSISSPVPKLIKTPKILGSVGTKIIKQNSFAAGSSKHGKYVIVTQSSASTTPTSKYTVGKKQALIKRVSGSDLGMATSAGTLTKVQNIAPEPSGNKIMILTDQQGQQQRVLLTPAQQKMMGYGNQGGKMTKTLVKGNLIQKTIRDGQLSAVPSSSGLISKSIASSRINSNQTLITSSGQVLTPIQSKTVRIDKSLSGRKIQMQSQKVPLKPPQQKTILIKNQHGQTVRKIQGTDDALLDKQVAEQIEAIKASGVLQQKQEILNYKSSPKTTFRRSYAKKIETPRPKPKETIVPPLAPISPKKTEEKQSDAKQQDRALHQLVIQDAMGNQTTITEGQILALPSETIDGQPQSYMLVTLDESGNLTPLNNEALLSLDPNLGIGGDLVQIDQSALKEEPEPEVPKTEPEEVPVLEPKEEKAPEAPQEQMDQSMVGEAGQQLIVTGDPIAAQKFLESLTEGNTDLANILASAEGSSILIHADGQQILINTDSDNQMLLSVNTDNMAETTEGGGNPIFANQPSKNQDILAAALADTDVFQQEQNNGQGKVSQLSPNSTLYPMNVGNVLETSLTLNSPIMTPLEVPSTNSKKISDENDILNQVPKNVDLPITITDPNISQTVSQQHVASLMANDLQTNLELQLPISEAITTSTEMNSPSFVLSLPSLETEINQKPFNSSMPLLDEVTNETKEKSDEVEPIKTEDDKSDKIATPESSFLDEGEGLCTLGGEMCSSLSEPPPDMFDLSAVLSSHQIVKEESDKEESKSATEEEGEVSSESAHTMNEDSCEIPVQPEIVTTLKEEGGENKREAEGEGEDANDSKKCKFD